MIKKFIEKRLGNSPTIVEVGAHYGEDTIGFLNMFKAPKIYCFEPDPRNIAVFREHITSDRVVLFETAVSDVDNRDIDFYQGYEPNVPDRVLKKYGWIGKKKYIDLKLNASGASSLKKGHKLVENANIVKVQTTRIDTWAEKNHIESIDFMWIDVQGAEREVISGFGHMSGHIKFVWTECGETAYDGAMTRKQTISLLSKMHFSLIEKYSTKNQKGNLLFQNQL